MSIVRRHGTRRAATIWSGRCWPRWRWVSGLGSGLAGVWSAGKIELGMVPWAAGGNGRLLLLPRLGNPGGARTRGRPTTFASCLGLLALGFTAGFYDVPLQAFLQHRSPHAIAAAPFWPPTIFSPSRRCSRRRELFWLFSEVLGICPPGRFSSSAALSRAGVYRKCPACCRWNAHAFRRMAADAAGLSRSGGRDGKHSRKWGCDAGFQSRKLGGWHFARFGLSAACSHDRLRAIFRGKGSGWFARAAGIIPVHPGSRAVVGRLPPPGRLYGRGTWFVSFQRGD